MSQPVACAKPVSVVADRIGDELIMNARTGEVIMSVGRQDSWYRSFTDIINVRMRASGDSLLMTWHVLGEILASPDVERAREEGLNFAYFIWMSSFKDDFVNFPNPQDFPWVVIVMGYTTTISLTKWWSYVIVATSPTEGQQYSLDFVTRNRYLNASIPLSILPFIEFYWIGGTTYQNRTLISNTQSIHDLTNITFYCQVP